MNGSSVSISPESGIIGAGNNGIMNSVNNDGEMKTQNMNGGLLFNGGNTGNGNVALSQQSGTPLAQQNFEDTEMIDSMTPQQQEQLQQQ